MKVINGQKANKYFIENEEELDKILANSEYYKDKKNKKRSVFIAPIISKKNVITTLPLQNDKKQVVNEEKEQHVNSKFYIYICKNDCTILNNTIKRNDIVIKQSSYKFDKNIKGVIEEKDKISLNIFDKKKNRIKYFKVPVNLFDDNIFTKKSIPFNEYNKYLDNIIKVNVKYIKSNSINSSIKNKDNDKLHNAVLESESKSVREKLSYDGDKIDNNLDGLNLSIKYLKDSLEALNKYNLEWVFNSNVYKEYYNEQLISVSKKIEDVGVEFSKKYFDNLEIYGKILETATDVHGLSYSNDYKELAKIMSEVNSLIKNINEYENNVIQNKKEIIEKVPVKIDSLYNDKKINSNKENFGAHIYSEDGFIKGINNLNNEDERIVDLRTNLMLLGEYWSRLDKNTYLISKDDLNSYNKLAKKKKINKCEDVAVKDKNYAFDKYNSDDDKSYFLYLVENVSKKAEEVCKLCKYSNYSNDIYYDSIDLYSAVAFSNNDDINNKILNMNNKLDLLAVSYRNRHNDSIIKKVDDDENNEVKGLL